MSSSTPLSPRGGVSRRRSWSSAWYMLSAFAVISYTSNWVYVLFAAVGAWIGGFLSVTALTYVMPQERGHPK